MKLSAMTLKHYAILSIPVLVAAVTAYQTESGHVLVIGGVAVAGVLSSLVALFSKVPS